MIPHVPHALRQRVVDRAGSRCEYCGLAQTGQEATFHIDHVMPIAEFRAMKMRPYLERALRHKGLLQA